MLQGIAMPLSSVSSSLRRLPVHEVEPLEFFKTLVNIVTSPETQIFIFYFVTTSGS
jgi:hypothetical protein